MNEKKSPFGDLCHQYRGQRHFSEQDMGREIEKLGYKLGTKPGSNKQPVVSQFERTPDPTDADRKQHRDPPLGYVEACARLFDLSSEQKFSLFVAALQSSEKIVIDKKAIEGELEDSIINILAALILSCTEVSKIIKIPKSLYDPDKNSEFLSSWKNLDQISQVFIEKLKEHHLEYKSILFQNDDKSSSPLL